MPIRGFYLASVGGGTPLNLVLLGLKFPASTRWSNGDFVQWLAARACSLHRARRASVASAYARCIVLMAVNPTSLSSRARQARRAAHIQVVARAAVVA